MPVLTTHGFKSEHYIIKHPTKSAPNIADLVMIVVMVSVLIRGLVIMGSVVGLVILDIIGEICGT